MEFDANGSAWEKIKYTGDLRKQRRDAIYWGVCVPSVCGAKSVLEGIKNAIKPLQDSFGVNANVELVEKNCKILQSETFDTLDISYSLILFIIIIIVLICTAVDTYTAYLDKITESFGIRILRSFSVRTNWLILCQGPAARDNDAGDLRSIHGLRFLSMWLIIMGHRCMFSLGGPLFNPERIEEIYTSALNMILLNGTIIVDTFFLISGFLSCYLMLLELDKKRKVNVSLLYAYRYIRLTPVYAMVVGFYATIYPKLGDGPMWDQKVGLERDRCRDNWWANLLYINNYVNAENMCMFQSWFLACDMHYFLLSPLIIYPLWRWPRPGKVLLFFITSLSIFVPFAVTLLGGLDAVLLLFMSTLADPVSNETFRSIYIPSHTRAAPYFIGIVWGYVLYKIRSEGIKINKKFAAVIFIFLHFVAFGSIFGAWAFYIPDIPRSALEKALYGGFHRAGWAISIGWLIVACALSLAGPYRALLSWKPMVPLGRLTYCAFLAHSGVQMYQSASMRVPEYMTYFKMLWMTLGDVSFTFGVALVLYMLFEAPVTALQRIFFKKDRKPAGDNQQLPVTMVQNEIRETCRA
ncbi:Hypothetical predicted protein [Cloeon dipterum]|uniref:Acyltransferase 3 domain-containing protein n=2 Tax=Cloeon dipterum TaxID=197152 RepID=A0A8S1BSF1_9INSE|nr:Hypothetical predicted protein [Cloeon dipterum]